MAQTPPATPNLPKKEIPRPDFSGQRQRLSAVPIDGYHLCWINDTPGNVAQYESWGYQFVDQDEQGGADSSNARGTDLGTRVRRVVGENMDSSPQYAYLMKVDDLQFARGMRSIEERNELVAQSIDRQLKQGQVPGESNFYATGSGGIKSSNQR